MLLESDSFGGVDIFEGTTPMKKGGSPQGSGTPAPGTALEGCRSPEIREWTFQVF